MIVSSTIRRAPAIAELMEANQLKAFRESTDMIVRGSPVGDTTMYWDLLDAARVHPWLRAAISAIGRTFVGMGWNIKAVDEKRVGTEESRKEIENFFAVPPDRAYNNVKDFMGTSSKMYLTSGCLRLFGVSAWEPIRNKLGTAVGFDYVWGVVVPQIDKSGNFLTPAWKVYTARDKTFDPVEYKDPNDLIVFFHPDFGGQIYGSDLEAIAKYSLPSDIYAMLSYLSLHSERGAPYDGMWVLPQETSDDSFNKFYALLVARYMGARNFGRNPLVVRGDAEFKSTRRGEDEAPYAGGRAISRQEIVGTVGTAGALVGVTEENNRANIAQIRKQVHEMTILPTQILIEDGVYAQVCVNEFAAPEWKLGFNPPDFLTVLEKAGVAVRLRDRTALSSNEMRRYVLNLPPREGGDDDWMLPSNMVVEGSVQGGAPQNPADSPADDTGDTGDNNTGGNPPRTDNPDQHRDDINPELVKLDLRKWRDVYKRSLKGQRPYKTFYSTYISQDAQNIIRGAIESGMESEQILNLFDVTMEACNNG